MAESEIKVSQELTEKRVPITRENVKYQGGGGGAVNSVNGQTGDVVLTAEDVGALPETTDIPSSVSDLNNDLDFQTEQQVATAIGVETTARQEADNGLQTQIDAISASSDVTDIVGTYAELQAYDTSTLGDKDIIKVLQDESRNDETTYYRWSTTTQTFTLIGEEGPYYTKSAADAKFQDKLTAGTNINIDANNEISATDTTYSAGTGLDLTGTTFSVDTTTIQEKLTAGANITIANDNTISATDTTYSDFTGTDGTTAGTAGLVPAPATTDAGKYLKADGTWSVAGGDVITANEAGVSLTVDGTWVRNSAAGIYKFQNGAAFSFVPTNQSVNGSYSFTLGANSTPVYGFLMNGYGSNRKVLHLLTMSDSSPYGTIVSVNVQGTTVQGVTDYRPIDNSDSQFMYRPLSAAQGRALNRNKLAVANLRAGVGVELVTAGTGANQTVTVSAVGDTETYTIADTDWFALTGAGVFTYSATVTATHTIGASTIAELLNDQAILFSTYGFAIGDITGQTVTIYSIGAPSSSVSLKINYKG